jgi:type VI secretion system secreted protein Hcp
MIALRRTLASSMLAAVLAFAPAALAADDAFLQVDGIPGESVDAAFRNAIVVRAFSLSIAGAGGGKATPGPLTVTKAIDKATPLLFRAALGAAIPKVELAVRKPGSASVFYKVTLNNVSVTSVKQSDAVSDGVAGTEEVTLAYQRILIEVFAQDMKTGAISGAPTARFGYDLTTAKAF